MQDSDHKLRALTKKSAQCDAESCRLLYEHLVDKVYAYVRYRTATTEQAIDLTQDSFIDLFAALKNFTYQSQAQFYAYVFVIVKRKLANHYAKTQEPHVELDEERTPSETGNHKQLETNHDVANALLALDEQTREIVVLHHWSRHTFGEIAILLDMTESAVRVRHHRALQTLATKLSA